MIPCGELTKRMIGSMACLGITVVGVMIGHGRYMVSIEGLACWQIASIAERCEAYHFLSKEKACRG